MKKPVKALFAASLLVVAGAFVFDQLFAVRAVLPPVRSGDPVPARPAPGDAPFHHTPFAPTWDARRAAFLDWVSQQPTPDERGGVWVDIAKLAFDPQTQVNPAALQDSLDFVNSEQDTADFHLAGLIRLYYLQADSGALTKKQVSEITRTFLRHKYWLDEPTPTPMELWTENHQILTYSSEYLAGQLFPQTVFKNNGETGSWHMQTARQRILRWIDWRSRTGMAEWDALIYYRMDLAALLNLVDFAQDEQVSTKAAMMVDLLLFDMGVDSFYGQYATSHGRATAGSIKSAAGQSMETVQALVWGLGRFQSASEMASVALATSPRYRVPPVIEAIGQDVPEELSNYERQSIPVTAQAAAQFGLSFQDINDIPIWWGMQAFTDPHIINLTIRTADDWKLWHYPDFRPLKDVAKTLKALHLLSLSSRLLDPDTNGATLSQVNKLTFRTPDYMLSSAQDYRKGEKGYQQHIWQATLGDYAVVFVTNPDSLREDDSQRPSYWSSDGRFPRTAQVRNVLVSIFNINRYPSPSIFEARHYAFTHAYFPRWAFDEVVEKPASGGGGWVFGRKGQGYVALYSDQPYQWQTQGPDAGQELIALGRQNVWICQLGRAAVDGSFQDFVEAVSAAPLHVRGLQVDYQAPGLGELSFGWNGPLSLDGAEVPLRDYPRWENPYLQAAFGSQQFDIHFQGKGLRLDFAQGRREEY
jgi:hypothetical protein